MSNFTIAIALSVGKLDVNTKAIAMLSPETNKKLKKVVVGFFIFCLACWLYKQIELKLPSDSAAQQGLETIRENKKLSCQLNPINNPDCKPYY